MFLSGSGQTPTLTNCVTRGTLMPPALGSGPKKKTRANVARGHLFGCRRTRIYQLWTMGQYPRAWLGPLHAGARSGLGGRRECFRSTNVLHEHLCTETIRFIHIFVVVSLANVTDLSELFVAEILACLAEGFERVFGLTRHHDIRHQT